MRYELYKKFECFCLFISESDTYCEVLADFERDCIIIDNKRLTVSGNSAPFNSELKDLILKCKLAKACDDIKEITDDYVRIIDEKEKIAQKECDLFYSNMK